MSEKMFWTLKSLNPLMYVYIYIALKAMHLTQGVTYVSHTTATITKHFFARKILANCSL